MTPEFRPYTNELTQIKEGLNANVTQLSERAQKKPSLLTQLMQNSVRRFHLPWYQDEQTKAQSALLQAQNRLSTLKEIRTLEIDGISDREWHARISIVNEKGVMDTVYLSHEMQQEHPYRGGKDSTHSLRFDGEYVDNLVHTYEWVIKDALKQRAKNIS